MFRRSSRPRASRPPPPGRRRGHVFASFEFLFLFLPAFFAARFPTPSAGRNHTILLLSWSFQPRWRVDFLALLGGVTWRETPPRLIVWEFPERTFLDRWR